MEQKTSTTTPPPAPKKQATAAPDAAKPRTRFTLTANVNLDEYNHVAAVYKYRLENGLSKDWNQFIRQCVDFAINYRFVKQEKTFGVPDDIQPMFLRDGYYSPLLNNKP